MPVLHVHHTRALLRTPRYSWHILVLNHLMPILETLAYLVGRMLNMPPTCVLLLHVVARCMLLVGGAGVSKK